MTGPGFPEAPPREGRPRRKLFVVDVESTCFPNGEAPAGFFSEIIEVGAAVVEIGPAGPGVRALPGLLVRPVLHPELSEFCRRLTGITQDEADGGIPYRDAATEIADLFRRETGEGPGAVFCSWGAYDRKMFLACCERFGVRYPFGHEELHVNLKQEFLAFYNVPRGKGGMDAALAHLGITLHGRHHRGPDDAANIARIACRMIEDGWSHRLLA